MRTWLALLRPLALIFRKLPKLPQPRRIPYPIYKFPRNVGRIHKPAKISTLFTRLLGRNVRVGVSSNTRAFAMGLWREANALHKSRAPGANTALGMACLTKVQLNKYNIDGGVIERVRDLFGDKNEKEVGNYPNCLLGYEMGSLMAVGCNAAVYEARLIKDIQSTNKNNAQRNSQDLVERREDYNLAIKMAFNYHATSNENRIIREMGKEMVPLLAGHMKSRLEWDRPLPSGHPNICPIYTAFVDLVPNLEGAAANFCWALPPQLHVDGVGHARTLFLVMKRYTMTLKEYLTFRGVTSDPSVPTLLLAQLMESLVFLKLNSVAHRDIKSNNILVDFDRQDDDPHLVLSDFGCCLSEGNTMSIPFAHRDQDLGGNMALLAPEIKTASPGPTKYLDYSLCDLWASGTMAYEIYTGINPFYMLMESSTYKEVNLPPLPDSTPVAVRKLVKQIMSRDPAQRPSVACAANVVGVSLTNLGAYVIPNVNGSVVLNKMTSYLQANVNKLALMFSAETILRANPQRMISRVEVEVRKTLLARVTQVDWTQAVVFILENSAAESSAAESCDA